MAPMPAGARSAAQANSAEGTAALTMPTRVTRSHMPGVKWRRSRHRNGSSTSAPSPSRNSTSGIAPKAGAATRMNMKADPQIAPSSRNSADADQEDSDGEDIRLDSAASPGGGHPFPCGRRRAQGLCWPASPMKPEARRRTT
jgi:hypothetical protein